MNHPIENRYRYGLCYDLNGQIVGFNLSPDVYIGLTDEEIERVLGVYAKQKYEQDEFLHTASDIAKSINQLVKKTDECGWISVSERLPEEGQRQLVLFCDIDENIMIGYHVDGGPDMHFTEYLTGEDIENVIAWMLLPEPYKVKSEDA